MKLSPFVPPRPTSDREKRHGAKHLAAHRADALRMRTAGASLADGDNASRFDDGPFDLSPAVCTEAFRAVAVAHEESNAIGTVELSCGPRGLSIQFVRISTHSDGYVPYPSTAGHRITVPYDQVARVLVDTAGLVHLRLDPSCTPYNKLVLAGLVRDADFDHAVSYRRRAAVEQGVSLAALLAWVPLAFGLRTLAAPLSPVLLLAIAATVSGIVHTLRRDIARRLVLFGPQTKRLRTEFIAQLALCVGHERLVRGPAEEPVRSVTAQPPVDESEVAEAGGLKTLFATAGVVAAIALVAIVLGKNLLFTIPTPSTSSLLTPEPWSPASPTDNTVRAALSQGGGVAPGSTPRAPGFVLPSCTCEHPDSPLWNDGIPLLSVLARNRPAAVEPARPTVRAEIAVVNNGSDDLKDVMLVVDFMGKKDGTGPVRVLGQKGLYQEGKLRPGEAIKWRVKGRGDDFAVTSFVSGKLGDPGINPAPADAFYKLLFAHTPVVRAHGAMMLAYLGDGRTREAVEKLEREGNPETLPTLAQIADAARLLRVCSVKIAPAPGPATALRLEACVFNASTETRNRPMITARVRTGQERMETRWEVEASLTAGTGVRTSGVIEVASDARAVEAPEVQLSAEP